MTTPNDYVLTLGETMGLVSGSRTGTFAHLSQAHIGIGGAESNVAVGMARLGIPVTWIGRVGDDSLGRRIVREIRGEGVDVRPTIDPDATTGLMLKEFRGRGNSRVSYYRNESAGSRLNVSDVDNELVSNAQLVHLTGITPLLSESARSTCLQVIQLAHAAGTRISIDINYRRSLSPPSAASEALRELCKFADVLFGSPEEIAMVISPTSGEESHEVERTQRPDDDRGIAALADGVDPSGSREVVVKRGPHGATACVNHQFFSVDGHSIEAVDTVGAGDAFVAGYLSGEFLGWSIEDKLFRANACGALLCTVPGDWEASPTPAEIDEFLDTTSDPVQR